MAIETVATHLADLRESRARSSEMESVTRERDTLLPGKKQKLDISNEQARLMLGELQKDAVLGDLIREKNIYTEAALIANIESDPDGFVADIIGAEELKTLGNDAKLVSQRADLSVGYLTPLRESMERIYERAAQGDPNYDPAADLRMLNQVFDKTTADFHVLGLNDVEDREDGSQVSRFPMLPGGAAQGEPLTLDHIEVIRYAERIAELHSEKSSARLLEEIKNRPGYGDALDVQKDQFSLLNSYKEGFKTSLVSGYGPAYEVNTEGKGGHRDHPDWGGPNEALRNALSQMAMNMGTDPSSAVAELTQLTRDTFKLHEGRYDPAGWGDYKYNTYVPNNITEYRGKKVEGNNTADYIERLETYIAQQAEVQTPQESADKFLAHNINTVFTNMVTAPRND